MQYTALIYTLKVRCQQHPLELSLFQPQQHLWPSLSKLDISGRYRQHFFDKTVPTSCLSNQAKLTSSKQTLVQIKGSFFFELLLRPHTFLTRSSKCDIKKVFFETHLQPFCHVVIALTHRGSRRYRVHLPDSAANDLNMVYLIESSYIFTIPRYNMTIYAF